MDLKVNKNAVAQGSKLLLQRGLCMNVSGTNQIYLVL